MIETARLLLREYTIEDVPVLHRIQSDATTMKFWATPFTEENTRSWIERTIASYASNGFGRYAVIHKGTNTQIGDVGMMRTLVNGKEEVDLGYIIHADHWRNGYAIEAASAVLQHGMDKKLPRIVANMAFDNIASQCVAEQLGMIKELEFINVRNRNIVHYLYAWQAALGYAGRVR